MKNLLNYVNVFLFGIVATSFLSGGIVVYFIYKGEVTGIDILLLLSLLLCGFICCFCIYHLSRHYLTTSKTEKKLDDIMNDLETTEILEQLAKNIFAEGDKKKSQDVLNGLKEMNPKAYDNALLEYKNIYGDEAPTE